MRARPRVPRGRASIREDVRTTRSSNPGAQDTESAPCRQLFFAVVAKKIEGSCRVLRDLHFGQAGARLVCSLIRCTTENRFRHFSHL